MKILVEPDKGGYSLWVKTEYSFEPCGWRMKKDGKFPIDSFKFDLREQAEEAQVKLQKYVSDPINMNPHRERVREKYVEESRSIFG